MRRSNNEGVTLLQFFTILAILLAVVNALLCGDGFLRSLTNAVASLAVALTPLLLTLVGIAILFRTLLR